MELRKRVVGDLYLASSIPFIFLAFLYFVFRWNGWVFLVIGLAIAVFGMETKRVMRKKEEIPKKQGPSIARKSIVSVKLKGTKLKKK